MVSVWSSSWLTLRCFSSYLLAILSVVRLGLASVNISPLQPPVEQDDSLEVSVVVGGAGGGRPLLQPHGGQEAEGRDLRPDVLQVEEVQGSVGHPDLQ